MNNQSITLREVLSKYRSDYNISNEEWYGLCRHYTRGTNPDLDTIRYYLSSYYRQFPQEQATDEMIISELLHFIEEYNK